MNTARKKSRDAKRISDIKQIQLALELYFDSNSSYASTTGGLSSLVDAGFLPSVPVDPLNTEGYLYVGLDSGSNDCAGSETCTSYLLGASLEQSGHSVLSSDVDTVDTDPVFNGADNTPCDGSGTGRYCYAVAP